MVNRDVRSDEGRKIWEYECEVDVILNPTPYIRSLYIGSVGVWRDGHSRVMITCRLQVQSLDLLSITLD